MTTEEFIIWGLELKELMMRIPQAWEFCLIVFIIVVGPVIIYLNNEINKGRLFLRPVIPMSKKVKKKNKSK